MRRTLPALAFPLALLAAGCAEGDPASEALAPEESAAFRASPVQGRSIRLLDVCDPETFNAAIGPGTCVDRNGGLTFAQFVRRLERHGTVESWRFMPEVINVSAGTTLPVVNVGGEVHTFTEVEEFGGGLVPFLNMLTGETDVAPECLTAGPEEFLPAGGHASHTFDEPGEEKYMCCIHPWMRSVARVR